MSRTHYDVVRSFAEGKTDLRGTSIFSRHDRLYSYGHHYTLAIARQAQDNKRDGQAWFLLNGDIRSRTTSGHLSLTFRLMPSMPRVAFSAIHAAGLDEASAIILDWTKDTYEQMKASEFNVADWPAGGTVTRYLDGYGMRMVQYHRVGACVLRSSSTGADYLCGMDEGSYFVSQLPHSVVPGPGAVDRAFDMLKPTRVYDAERMGLQVLRQGEWYFVPTDLKIPDKVFSQESLPYRDARSNRHVVRLMGRSNRYVMQLMGRANLYYVKGVVYHRTQWGTWSGEHRSLKLERNVVYEAIRNTSVGDWSADGRVD